MTTRMTVRALPWFVLALVCACGDSDPPPKSPAPIATAIEPPAAPLAIPAGVDQAAMDLTANPCDDFFQYACGGWVKNTPIPGDEEAWDRSFSPIRDRNEEILHTILEGFAKGDGKGEPYQKELGDFYASCMDEAGIDKLGTKPLEPWTKAIDGVTSPGALYRVIGKLQADGIPTLISLGASQAFADVTRTVAFVEQAGIGMPEREYYLSSDAPMVALRAKYLDHVAAMLVLAGEPDAKAKEEAKKILEVETKIATVSMTKEDRREPKKIAHAAKREELAKVAPGFDWTSYLEGAGLSKLPEFNISQPDFTKGVGELIGGKVALGDWKIYLKWHTFRVAGDVMGKKFVDENFKWKAALTGAEKLPDRWKRCVREIDGDMGEALGQSFAKKTLGADGKADVVAQVKSIEAAMRDNLGRVLWMDDATKKAAFAKLDRIGNKIAYPDKWRSYAGLSINRGDYPGNSLRANAFEIKRQMTKVGKPIDRTEWFMSPPTVNAYNDPQMNEMVFPAGILQTPFYAKTSPPAFNFGGIGVVMGHELTHDFDDQGRQFDADGNLRDWWAPAVNTEFERRAGCVKKQFDDYTVLGDLHVNGQLTLGENIADLGGFKLSLAALHAKSGASQEVDQQFFFGFAQSWCTKFRDESLRHLVATNPHAPDFLRVIGPMSNMPEFAAAFSCKAGSKMVRANRCEVW